MVDFGRLGFLKGSERRSEFERLIKELDIRPPVPETLMRNLSGGNQQKVVIARWLATGANVFLFDEPTRGIDVGAKSEIHTLLRKLAADGAAVMVVSSELPEVLMLSHRIGIVKRGRMNAVVDNGPNMTEEKLMKLAAVEEFEP